MRKRPMLRGRRLTYSNVVSTICLFLLAGGGAAYAAGHLGKNSVGAKQLKKNAVTTAKIKNEAVTAAKVKKGTLTGTQINASTLGTVPAAQTAQTADQAATAGNGAVRIDYDHPADASEVPILKLDELTLTAKCYEVEGYLTYIALHAVSTQAASVDWSLSLQYSGPETVYPTLGGISLVPNESQEFFFMRAEGGWVRAEGQLVYRNSSRVIAITLHSMANWETHRCQVNGVAVPAPG